MILTFVKMITNTINSSWIFSNHFYKSWNHPEKIITNHTFPINLVTTVGIFFSVKYYNMTSKVKFLVTTKQTRKHTFCISVEANLWYFENIFKVKIRHTLPHELNRAEIKTIHNMYSHLTYNLSIYYLFLKIHKILIFF